MCFLQCFWAVLVATWGQERIISPPTFLFLPQKPWVLAAAKVGHCDGGELTYLLELKPRGS